MQDKLEQSTEENELDVFKQMLLENAEQFRESLLDTVEAFAKVVEARDPYTSGHQSRVAVLATKIGEEMNLGVSQIEGIRLGPSIHDIGKIHLPAELLTKPTKLTDLEFELIKNHAQAGFDILKNIRFPWPVAKIAYQHHERLDGSGYPQGLKANEICLEAKIVAVADVVEAIASFRPYRPALGVDASLQEISINKGILYDATVVDACLRLFNEKDFSFPVK
jgi:putative nucleotidyltransferase with HDIG domain